MPVKKEKGRIRMKSEEELISHGYRIGRNSLKPPRHGARFNYEVVEKDKVAALGREYDVELITDDHGEYARVEFEGRPFDPTQGMYHVLSRASSARAEGEATDA